MTVVIDMRVLKRGERTDRLLEQVADRLGKEYLRPTDAGLLPIRMDGDVPSEAWERVLWALDEADGDWETLVTIGQRPG